MDYKEKYEMALERAKNLHRDAIDMGETLRAKQCEIIFPELAESEDEKIMKSLITFFQRFPYENYDEAEKEKADFVGDGFIECHADFLDFKEGNTYWLEYIGDDKYNVRSDNLLGKTYHITPCQLYTVFKKLTWLEKQGEQKVSVGEFNAKDWYVSKVDGKIHNIYHSVDKVEPKFKVGDWITDGQLICKVLSVTSKSYELHLYNDDYCHFETDVRSVDERYHLWTIEDAKDGDVLVAVDDENDERRPFIYKGCLDPNHPDSPVAYCGIDTEGYFCTGNHKFNHWWTDEKVQPATKEQRDLLFQKMREAGYQWDAEKKELKKLEQEDEEYNGEDYGIDSLYHAISILETTLGKVKGYQTDDGILSHKCAITAVKKLYKMHRNNGITVEER